MPPSRSGIADYSALLLPALRERVGLEVEHAADLDVVARAERQLARGQAQQTADPTAG